jgi:hypothetical protein
MSEAEKKIKVQNFAITSKYMPQNKNTKKPKPKKKKAKGNSANRQGNSGSTSALIKFILIITSRVIEFIGKRWKIIIGLGALAALLWNSRNLYEWFKSPHQKYEEARTETDVLKAPPVVKQAPPLHPNYRVLEKQPTFFSIPPIEKDKVFNGILLDSAALVDGVKFVITGHLLSIPVDSLRLGVTIPLPITNGSQLPISMYQDLNLLVKKNRLYTSIEFRDLQTGHLAGKLEYNKWTLYTDEIRDYHPTDDKLEVIDKEGYIMFSLDYSPMFAHTTGQPWNVIQIAGYLVNESSVLVLANKRDRDHPDWYYFFPTIDPQYKANVRNKLKTVVKTIFPPAKP